LNQLGVALSGRNRTVPPCSVDRPTAHVPGSITDDNRWWQTDDRCQRAKQYWPIMRASMNCYELVVSTAATCWMDFGWKQCISDWDGAWSSSEKVDWWCNVC